MQFKSAEGAAIPVFPQILVIVLSRIVLYVNVQNFARNILTLKDDIDINFASIA